MKKLFGVVVIAVLVIGAVKLFAGPSKQGRALRVTDRGRNALADELGLTLPR